MLKFLGLSTEKRRLVVMQECFRLEVSQRELAKRTGLSRRQVIKFFVENFPVPNNFFELASKALGLSVIDLDTMLLEDWFFTRLKDEKEHKYV